MKMEKVRCWKVGEGRSLFITYPEGDMGHRLICCKACGQVHAVNLAKQLYVQPDLEKHLAHLLCFGCGKGLAGAWAWYPEHFVDESGQMGSFERPLRLPVDADSIVAEFPEVFS